MNYLKLIRNSLWIACIGLPAGLAAQNLQVLNGCRIILNGPVHLVLHNAGITNNGFLQPSNVATVQFTGGDRSVTITGNNVFTFSNVIIDKPGNKTVELQQTINVIGTITMNSGNVLLNNRTLNLGNIGSISGEKSQSHITGITGGRVQVSRSISAPGQSVNPGNIGVELTSQSVPGFIFVERTHTAQALPNGELSIYRSFNIMSGTNPVLTATLRFFYLDEELNGNNEQDLYIWSGSGISNSWILEGKDDQDETVNWVKKNGLVPWNRFTLADRTELPQLSVNNSLLKQGLENPSLITKARIYPNPSKDQCNLEFFSTVEKDIMIDLCDQSGHILQQKKINAHPGINKVPWNLVEYPAGIYYIIFQKTAFDNIKILKL